MRRIFEMYATGISPQKIAETFNEEGIVAPSEYAFRKYGQKPRPGTMGLWQRETIVTILDHPIYRGHLAQMQVTSVSYKNHKRFRKDKNEWIVVYNNHEPIISTELWNRVKERRESVSHGRKTANGTTHPLSGFMFCMDCGAKMKMTRNSSHRGTKSAPAFNCGYHLRYGKAKCFSHNISAKVIENIVLTDIREMAQKVIIDENAVRTEFLQHNAELADNTIKTAKKELKTKQRRLEELKRLIELAYEDRMKGKMPEDICIKFIEKYVAEQKTLAAEVEALEAKISETETAQQSVDDFLQNVKKYIEAPKLTREMCFELIDRVLISGIEKYTGKERVVEIVYKADIMTVLRKKNKK